MALPDLSVFCVSVQNIGDVACISFPGGASICAQAGFEFGDPTEITKSIIGQLNSACAPLQPLFLVLDTVAALFKCVKAVKDCLGPPPNPAKLVKCLPDVAKKVDQILKLIPQLSIPAMIRSFIDVLILMLQGLKGKLAALVGKQLQITAAALRAAELGNIQLTGVCDCAQDNLDAQLTNLNAGLDPLNRFMGIISAFMQIAGVGCLPPLGAASLQGDILSPIDAFISILRKIKAVIPDIPSVAFGGAGDDC